MILPSVRIPAWLLWGHFALAALTGLAAAAPPQASPYAKWPHGPSADPGFFPLGVWLQDPSNAERYKAAGFNLYVGLWKGPTEAQLAALKKAGLRVLCDQNSVGLSHLEDDTIAGWLLQDEPDNAQSRGARLGWGAPVPPAKIVETCARVRRADPSRPVLLNLGQGVAWDGWYGRGSRTRHPEDYPQYIQGGDIVSFDIYPVVHDSAEVRGKLWYVAAGVRRLVQWSAGRRAVWNAIECTHISNPDAKATPHQVRCEAWMSLIHGSRGLIYFVHQFKPVFREPALLDDAEMLAAVTALNRQITELAPILNSPTVQEGESGIATNAAAGILRAQSSVPTVPVAFMLKHFARSNYLFAVGMRAACTRVTFEVPALPQGTRITVLGENRELTAGAGSFDDQFDPWSVHLYRY